MNADPYRAWIAEVMLQQTQVATAIPYFRRFLARFPTLEALAAAREEDVLAAWSGLGYYARARRLGPAAREALARFGGLPASVEALRALPGLGPYTAGAVASIAFGLRAPAVDGNVARVLSRLFLVTGDPASPRVRRRLEALAAELVPESRPGDFNQALMEFGATLCGKPPACRRCPVARHCGARTAGREGEIPAARARPARTPLLLVCAVDPAAERVALVRRAPGGLFGGLWLPPHAEIAHRGDPRRALASALSDLFGPRAGVGEVVAEVRRVLTHRDLTLRAYGCRLPRGRAGRVRWVHPSEIDDLGVPAAARRLLEAVRDEGEGTGGARPRGS